MASIILGTGSYLPEQRRTNEDISKLGIMVSERGKDVPLTPEGIIKRTGISERRVASPQETVEFMASEAAKKALLKSNVSPRDITALFLATGTGRDSFSTSVVATHSLLGLNKDCYTLLNQGSCCGFLQALSAADSHVSAHGGRALVIASEIMSNRTHTDEPNHMIFGDGAGAMVIRQRGLHSNFYNDQFFGKIVSFYHETNSDNRNLITQRSDGTACMEDGAAVLKDAVHSMSEAVRRVCSSANWKLENLDYVIPHQANKRIIDGVVKSLDVSPDKVYSEGIRDYGNMSSATCIVALDECLRGTRSKKIERPDRIVLVTYGAGGITSAAAISYAEGIII